MDASPKLEAAADASACAPQPVDNASLSWTPPKAPTLGVCTDKQISDKWAQCEDATTYSPARCDAFDRDAQNTACLNCLFSTADESKYGPLYYIGKGAWDYNYAACIALQDGDSSATGCGAKVQATRHCANTSCSSACPVFTEFTACWTKAYTGVCKAYDDMTSCSRKPTYYICFSYPTERDKFLAYGAMFCGSGIDAGALGEGGLPIGDASVVGTD